jgi:hypothetical protein
VFILLVIPGCLGFCEVAPLNLTFTLGLHPGEVHSPVKELEAAQMFSINPAI